jgi:cell division protein FtsN
MKNCRQYTSLSILAPIFMLLVVFAGCSGTTATSSAGREVAKEPEPAQESTRPPLADTEESPYDLEEEMPEEDAVDPDDLEETIEPIEIDSVVVEEVAAPATPDAYGIGYRVQIFASGERAAAESLKIKAAGETSLPVYIEYEDGYYKVRVGDFGSRDEAAEARARLSEIYPDCWLVTTTIQK